MDCIGCYYTSLVCLVFILFEDLTGESKSYSGLRGDLDVLLRPSIGMAGLRGDADLLAVDLGIGEELLLFSFL